MNITDSAYYMNIVYWIRIHESIDDIYLHHTVKYIFTQQKS